MRGLQKSKRVSWATDGNLCQIRLFLSEESPSQVGSCAQDHLQAKSSWLSHPSGTVNEEFLPPGFTGDHPADQIKVSEIPVFKWKCPSQFAFNLTWLVVAGEESKEVELQNEREMRVLEAVYPRPSAIPPDPAFPTDIEVPQHNEQIPLIPITPIEDEDTADASSGFMVPPEITMGSQAQSLAPGVRHHCSIPVNERPAGGVLYGVEPDLLAAASAAFASINKSNDQGNLIDNDLLLKILSNPKLIEKLVTDYGATANAQSLPRPIGSFAPSSDPPPPPPPVMLADPAHLHMNRTETSIAAPLPATSPGPFYPQPNGIGMGPPPNARGPPQGVPPSMPPVGAPQMKDMNYYKNLIQQHGGERREPQQQFGSRYSHQLGPNQEFVNASKLPRDQKPRINKPCIYYNSSRGCRHGANCAYQHDASSQQRSNNISDVPSAKRTKMDREISS